VLILHIITQQVVQLAAKVAFPSKKSYINIYLIAW